MKRTRRRAFGRIVKWQGRWCARWQEDGRLRQKSFRGSKALAQRFLSLKQIELEERAATGGMQPIDRIRFKALLDRHEEVWKGQKAMSTIVREAAYLRSKAEPFFGKMWVDEVTRADIERWLVERVRDGISSATRNRYVDMISAFFRRAVALGHARANPAAGIRRTKEALKPVPFLDVAAQARVIAATQGLLRVLVTLLLDTGLRLGEALRLRWSDIDFDRQLIVVRRSKNYTSREVPFTSRGRAVLLAEWNRDEGKTPDREAVVLAMSAPDKAGEPDLFSQYRREWWEARKRAGFPKLTLHDLRHVFAVTAVRAGVTLGELRELLGHKSLVMTMRYSRHCPTNMSTEAGKRLEELLSKSTRLSASDSTSGR